MKYILFILLYLYMATGGCYAAKNIYKNGLDYTHLITKIAVSIGMVILEAFLWLPMLFADFIINNVEKG